MNLLIDKNGKQVICTTSHVIQCRTSFGIELPRFLFAGGVRVAAYQTHLTIEAGTALTAKQKRIVNRILKDSDYYSVHISIGRNYTLRDDDYKPVKHL